MYYNSDADLPTSSDGTLNAQVDALLRVVGLGMFSISRMTHSKIPDLIQMSLRLLEDEVERIKAKNDNIPETVSEERACMSYLLKQLMIIQLRYIKLFDNVDDKAEAEKAAIDLSMKLSDNLMQLKLIPSINDLTLMETLRDLKETLPSLVNNPQSHSNSFILMIYVLAIDMITICEGEENSKVIDPDQLRIDFISTAQTIITSSLGLCSDCISVLVRNLSDLYRAEEREDDDVFALLRTKCEHVNE
jgi:hypothetical protein